MNLFDLNKSQPKVLKIQPLKLEKEIQQLVEANLQVLFALGFVKSEFQLKHLRIDTIITGLRFFNIKNN